MFLQRILVKDDEDVKTMPLSDKTVSRRIYEMSKSVEKELVQKPIPQSK